MELFCGQDVAMGFLTVLQPLIDEGVVWITFLGVRVTMFADVFAPRQSKPSRNKPMT
jgi:hypothetical protein